MRYIPHTKQDITRMLETVGIEDVDALFAHIPESLRQKAILNLPQPLGEHALISHLADLAGQNTGAGMSCFVGAGSYNHHIPPIVDQMLLRSEFLTAYTPYQPEISQGTLQALFEFQTMVARLLEMEVSSASLYDGAGALAEAVIMAARKTRKNRFLVSDGLNPNYRKVVGTYTKNLNYEFIPIPVLENGRTDLHAIAEMQDDEIAAVIVQSPNYFGVIEDLRNAGKIIGPSKARFIVSFTEALAYGMLSGPGKFGADIVCGEGQSLGIPMSFGGPNLGLFTARMADVRNMPGRLCGQTLDKNGQTGYVLTLATREQHIRREKATSNICTNQSLCALAACIYMSCLGASGLPELAKINHAKSTYFKRELAQHGAVMPLSAPTFNEFVYEVKSDADTVLCALNEEGFIGGIKIGREDGRENRILTCVTEMISIQEMDRYVQCVKKSM